MPFGYKKIDADQTAVVYKVQKKDPPGSVDPLPFFLQILSSSVRSDGNVGGQPFSGLSRDAVGFRSEFWLDQSNMVPELFCSHSSVIVAVCLLGRCRVKR